MHMNRLTVLAYPEKDDVGTKTSTLGILLSRLSGKTVDEGGVVSHNIGKVFKFLEA